MNTMAMNDGHSIPVLGYGTWRITDQAAPHLVAEAIAVGYRHIDTASIYENETGVGRGIAESGVHRDELFVTTKLWPSDHRRPQDALSRSLDKLGMDHVDLYLIHWPAPAQNRYVHAWETMIDLREQGLTTSIGASNFLPAHLDALRPTEVVPVVNQIERHPSFTNLTCVAANEAQEILTECYVPLGRAQDLSIPVIQSLAAEMRRSPAQVVIAWHMSHGHLAIPKSSTPSRIAENFQAGSLRLNSDQIAAIDSLDSGNRICGHPADFVGI